MTTSPCDLCIALVVAALCLGAGMLTRFMWPRDPFPW